MPIRIDPASAWKLAAQIRNAADDARDGEHVVISANTDYDVLVGISNGHLVRNEHWVPIKNAGK